MAHFADAIVVGTDLVRAAEAAATEVRDRLEGAPDLAAVFVCGDEPDAVTGAGQAAMRVLDARSAIGCSASGVLASAGAVEGTRAVSVWGARLPGVRVRTFHLEVMRSGEGLAVIGLPERRAEDALAVVLADPFSFPADGFVDRANSALAGLPMVGGLAGMIRGPRTARLFVDGRSVERGAVGVLLGGEVGARTLVSQGCRPVGPAMTVTAAEQNVLLELAGTPALTKLEQVVAELPLEEQALVSTGLQIGVAIDEYSESHEHGDFLVRGIIGADRERGGLVIADVVSVGRTARFQVRDADSADRDLRERLARFATGEPSGGALLFSCNGRGRALFGTAEHDVTAVRDVLGLSGVAGFFAAGEIGPVGGRNFVHGFTASLVAFPGG